MKLIGLTGGIATGKSTVAQMLHDQGCAVVDADQLAREVVEPGSFGFKAVVQAFGPGVVKDNQLDRQILRKEIFSDNKKRELLEKIIHPLVQWRAQKEFDVLRRKGEPYIFYDVPLLFEKNLNHQFDLVLVVSTQANVQVSRLIGRDKLKDEEARQIIESQIPVNTKAAAAHFVVDNSGSLGETRQQVAKLLDDLKLLKK